MSFFAVLFALLLEQVKPLPRGNVVHDALTGWMRGTARNFDAGTRAAMPGWSGASPCSCRRSLRWRVYVGARRRSARLLGLAFDVAVLYLTLGFRQFSHYFTDIRDALDRGDEIEARRLLAEWRHLDASELPASELLRHVIEHSLLAAHRHVFGVFFWFVLLSTFGLGPAGAVLYRHGRVRQPLLVVPQRRRRGIAVNETPDASSRSACSTCSTMCRRASPPRASPSSATSRRRSTAGAATRALWKYDNEGVILAAAAGAVGVQPRRRLGARAHARTAPRPSTPARRPSSAAAEGSTPGAPPQLGHLRSVVGAGLALGRPLDAAAGAALARHLIG